MITLARYDERNKNKRSSETSDESSTDMRLNQLQTCQLKATVRHFL